MTFHSVVQMLKFLVVALFAVGIILVTNFHYLSAFSWYFAGR